MIDTAKSTSTMRITGTKRITARMPTTPAFHGCSSAAAAVRSSGLRAIAAASAPSSMSTSTKTTHCRKSKRAPSK